ncbi:dTDP-4-dehydrorhamnose reductase [Achromobacter sp. GG226]|uniref:dTDP-4-dehydrorhamnose reductase n=1 Tax=Verticiella alkaliphila TaxID=2779529 RepID=UPI00209BAB62|nr:dTDP-4-dehydrorhamnose reductase [Verticiella sp. GG226]MBU4609199.1 dTDP-4-dehydrorhamnose reductase [Verticiella sp. GG226]
MRIWLTGGNGQVGYELRRSLALLGEVQAPGRDACDLQDPDAIRRAVREWQPDVIVNPAAYTAVDKAESDSAGAEAVNVRAPAVLAEEAERLGAMLVHFSTDYVFDGTQTQPYTEDDTTNPQGVYGATKLAGEVAVQAACSRHLILRTSWVVGAHGGNFLKTMLRLAGQRASLNVVADQTGAPTSADLLADLTALLVREASRAPTAFPYGLYHATAAGATTWHAYAQHVVARAAKAGRALAAGPQDIHPISTDQYPTPARRPANSQLDTGKLSRTFGLRLPSWQDGVDRVLDHVLRNPS